MKEAPSPYRMNQEHLLPKFNQVVVAASAFTAETPDPTEATSAAPPVAAPRSIWRRLIGRWARSEERSRPKPAAIAGRAIQTELSLNAVRVVRNDLKDSEPIDGPGRVGKRREPDAPGQSGMVWNRVSARLLRQAVQEFNVVQRERGKLLSHTDSSGGGPRRA